MEYDNADGFDNYLFRSMMVANKSGANMVLSPVSVLSAMSICMLGAANNTLKEMMAVMYPDKEQKVSFEISAKIVMDLIKLSAYYNTTYSGADDNAIIRIANKLWISDKGPKILDKYIKASQADAVSTFSPGQADAASKAVNDWCAKATNKMITELVKAEMMANAKMVITNAIYFCGKFVKPFDKDYTRKNESFYASQKKENEVSKVDMMFNEGVHTAAFKGEFQY